jgi:hypothetical protein
VSDSGMTPGETLLTLRSGSCPLDCGGITVRVDVSTSIWEAR